MTIKKYLLVQRKYTNRDVIVNKKKIYIEELNNWKHQYNPLFLENERDEKKYLLFSMKKTKQFRFPFLAITVNNYLK